MSNEVLSQEEIEKMLTDSDTVTTEADADDILQQQEPEKTLLAGDYLTKDEQDLLGEIGNICMGTSATTMSTLLGRKTTITTPEISIHTVESLAKEYPAPLVVSEIKYTSGLEGNNLLILKEYDVAKITNLMLGDEEEIDPDNIELTEIHMSAIGEIMNQMVGSSATALADMLHKMVDISTPVTRRISIQADSLSESFNDKSEAFVRISFHMEIEDLLTSEIMQVLTVSFAKELAMQVLRQMQDDMGADTPTPDSGNVTAVETAQNKPLANQENRQDAGRSPVVAATSTTGNNGSQQVIHEQQNIRVQQPQFPSFNETGVNVPVPSLENIEMILDVPMSVTVELGRVKKKIKEILEFNTGSVVVLDRPAGETVDILVNGKCIGKGEVVVIDDNYGVRITEINMPNAQELL